MALRGPNVYRPESKWRYVVAWWRYVHPGSYPSKFGSQVIWDYMCIITCPTTSIEEAVLILGTTLEDQSDLDDEASPRLNPFLPLLHLRGFMSTSRPLIAKGIEVCLVPRLGMSPFAFRFVPASCLVLSRLGSFFGSLVS